MNSGQYQMLRDKEGYPLEAYLTPPGEEQSPIKCALVVDVLSTNLVHAFVASEVEELIAKGRLK